MELCSCERMFQAITVWESASLERITHLHDKDAFSFDLYKMLISQKGRIDNNSSLYLLMQVLTASKHTGELRFKKALFPQQMQLC